MLFNDFDGALGTLYLTCSANEAFIEVHYGGFLIVYLKDLHRANVNTGSASSAFFFIDLNLNHEGSAFLRNLMK